MKKIISLVLIIGLIVIIILKLKVNKEITKNRVYVYNKEAPIKVFVDVVEERPLSYSQVLSGKFFPEKEVRVNTEVPGKVLKVYVEEGQKVKKGQALVKQDDSELKTQLSQINIKIKNLEKDYKRYKILAENDAIPGVKFEKIQEGLKTAQAQKRSIMIKINNTLIKAPFTGFITKKFVEAGAFAAPGVPIVALTDTNQLKFTINVPSGELDYFKTGKTYPILVDAFPDLKLTGKVVSIGEKGNMSNKFPVQFQVNNTKDKKIKANMFGKINVDLKEKKVLAIPEKAIVGSDLEPKVYRVQNKKAHLTPIVTGKRFNNILIVKKGLKPGDTIVTAGFINLFDGANVIPLIKKED